MFKKITCQLSLNIFSLIWKEVDILWRIVDFMNLMVIVSHPISIQIRELNLHDFFPRPHLLLPLTCSGPTLAETHCRLPESVNVS